MKDIWQRILDLERRNLRIGQVIAGLEETMKQAETAKTLLSATPRIVITGTEPETPFEFTPYVRLKMHGITFNSCDPVNYPPYTAPVSPQSPYQCPVGLPSPFAISEQDKLFENTLCLLTETYTLSGVLHGKYRTTETINGNTSFVAELIATENGSFSFTKSIKRINTYYRLDVEALYSGSPVSFAIGTSGNIRTGFTMLSPSGFRGDAFDYQFLTARGVADMQISWGV